MEATRFEMMTGGRVTVMAKRLALVLLAVLAVSLSACAGTPAAPERKGSPKVAPPVVGKAGVLRVAVDAHYPPFASKQGDRIVGLDADLAAALAAQLGLEAELVEVPTAALGAALREKRVDVALGGLSLSRTDLSEVTVATSYLADGPALFSRAETVTAERLDGLLVAVQQGSASYWMLKSRLGDDQLVVYPQLRQALAAVDAGTADAAAGDAIVSGYISREYGRLRYAGQLGEASPLAVTVAKDADVLEPAIREAVDELAATGVLDALHSKWVGSEPRLHVGGSEDTSEVPLPIEATSAVDSSLVVMP